MVLRGSQDKSSAADRRFTDGTQAIDTRIGADTHFEGQIRGTSNVEISGEVKGEVEVDGLVWLRPGGRLTATVKATDLVLEGEASGAFVAAAKIDLRATAHVVGELSSNSVAMAEGSFFEGTIAMAGKSGEASVLRYEEKRSADQASDSPEKP